MLALGVVGCPSGPIRDDAAGTGLPEGVRIAADRFDSTTGCEVETLTYLPAQPRTDVLVVVAHGFLRDQRRMAGLATGLAAEGIPAATLSFCNSKPWRGGHRENAADMRRLADRLGATRVIYAGFSAGGLSAVIAASEDPRTRGVLTLDLVDDPAGTAARLAPALRPALVGLMGEPAPCNANGNGLAVFAATPGASLETIPRASHCDFESPTDWLCESVCERPDRETAARRAHILDQAVAGVQGLLLDPPPDERAAGVYTLKPSPRSVSPIHGLASSATNR